MRHNQKVNLDQTSGRSPDLAEVGAGARLGQAHQRLQLARRDGRAALRRARLRAQVQVEGAQHLTAAKGVERTASPSLGRTTPSCVYSKGRCDRHCPMLSGRGAYPNMSVLRLKQLLNTGPCTFWPALLPAPIAMQREDEVTTIGHSNQLLKFTQGTTLPCRKVASTLTAPLNLPARVKGLARQGANRTC